LKVEVQEFKSSGVEEFKRKDNAEARSALRFAEKGKDSPQR